MNNLNTYIIEKLHLNKDTNVDADLKEIKALAKKELPHYPDEISNIRGGLGYKLIYYKGGNKKNKSVIYIKEVEDKCYRVTWTNANTGYSSLPWEYPPRNAMYYKTSGRAKLQDLEDVFFVINDRWKKIDFNNMLTF